MKEQIPIEKIRKIRDSLKRGSYQIISDSCDVTYGHVSDVLNGWSYSEDVILCAAMLVKEQTQKREIIDEI